MEVDVAGVWVPFAVGVLGVCGGEGWGEAVTLAPARAALRVNISQQKPNRSIEEACSGLAEAHC